jgi:prepilin-type N-terminal cleavage/methylation domain-containing protein
MITNKSKGFTIIELLVVVAIIAVLAAIVLVNVTGYINQGKNAAIKGNLSTILTNGAVYFDANSNYGTSGAASPVTTGTNFCTNTYVTAPMAAVSSAGGTGTCSINSTYTAWCACATLKDVTGATGQTFCVDSTGTKTQTSTACATECPAAAACL